jgi:DNA-binding NarL/FixJ family response regulator
MIRVLLVDDDPLVRFGLRLMLRGAPDMEVTAEATDGAEVAALVAEHSPDIVLMDIRMPGMDGLAATEALRTRPSSSSPGSTVQEMPHPPEVLVLTTFNSDEHVLRALRAGAAGFLLKDTPPQEIVAAVRKVVAGEPVLSPAVTQQLIAQVSEGTGGRETRAERARAQLALLGDREREVAVAVGQGETNAEIAAELYMSVATVKTHVSRILAKLDLNNRVQIALVVYDAGAAD